MQPSDEIKQKLDIVDVIKEYMPLQQAGMNFRARCPFHSEKTPSFMVSPDKQIYHCFGCGKGGDLISFVMEMEGLDFIEALRVLAPKAGVILQRQDPKITSKRNKLLDIMDLSSKYYHKILLETDEAKYARDYLKQRGVSDETIDEWRIGCGFDSWDGLLNFLRKKGFRDDDIFSAGMISKSNNGNKFFDRFRDRIMFPIRDVNGNVVAFSARVNPQNEAGEKMGKYINSPQSILYDKSNILFGLDKAKTEIRKIDYAIIVEGQMDAISAHQAGFKNAVASSGTALTEGQCSLLKRFSKNIKLAFDMDSAGEMAADRGIKELMSHDMNIKVIELEEGKDPDDCIRENPEDWIAAVKNAKPMMEYYFDINLAKYNIEKIDEKKKFTSVLLGIIARIENKIEKDFWLKKLAQKINVEERLLVEALEGEKKSAGKYKLKADTPSIKMKMGSVNMRVISHEEKMSEYLLAFVLKHFYLFEYLSSKILPEHIFGEDNKNLYKKLLIYYNNAIKNTSPESNEFDYQGFKHWLKDEFGGENDNRGNQFKIIDKLVILGDKEFSEVKAEEQRSEIIKLYTSLKKIYYRKELKKIEDKIAILEKEKNNKALSEELNKLKKISDELSQLNRI